MNTQVNDWWPVILHHGISGNIFHCRAKDTQVGFVHQPMMAATSSSRLE